MPDKYLLNECISIGVPIYEHQNMPLAYFRNGNY